MSNFRHLSRKEINIDKWNQCIDTSANGLIYAKAEYLDNLAGNWDALIWDEYESVMPLTGNRKYGARYLYQPPFCQQLGMFGDGNVDAFLTRAKELYSYAEISLNFSNVIAETSMHIKEVTPRQNFMLDLNTDYENIAADYSHDLKKNLQRSRQFQLTYREAVDAEKTISLYRHSYGPRFPYVKPRHYEGLLNFCLLFPHHYLIREAWDNDQLVSAALCLKDNKRIYFIISTTIPEGRNKEANHFLVDQLIREFSGKKLLLDFEGSDIEGIATFYKNFGAISQPYPFIKWNNLRWPWRVFKK